MLSLSPPKTSIVRLTVERNIFIRLATIEEVREIAHNYSFNSNVWSTKRSAIVGMCKPHRHDLRRDRIRRWPVLDGSEINLYRIVQESLNNIVKHSDATAASLRITRGARHVSIQIQDNGKGFDRAAQAAGAGGFGLTGIAERARILGGKETIRSAPHEGTTIILEIALPDGHDRRHDERTG